MDEENKIRSLLSKWEKINSSCPVDETTGSLMMSSTSGRKNKNKHFYCKTCGISFLNMFQCSKCHKTKYCSDKCQREDWKNHKNICKI